jgi:hypothetical protein
MGRLTRVLVALAVVLVGSLSSLVFLTPTAASAHDDRDPISLTGQGGVPQYHTAGTSLLVCGTDANDFNQRIAAFPADVKTANSALWTQCQKSGLHSIQAAVAAVNQPNMIIKILPGLYQETPSLAPATAKCANLPAAVANLGYQILSWQQQQDCPNLQNLIAIQSKQNLQIEGTGAQPSDVVIDAQYRKLMAVRADRSPGLYLRNFTTEHTTSTGIYVMESDGLAVDHVLSRFNAEDGVDAYADDHALFTGCEAYGNGYAGLAAESTSDTLSGSPGWFAVEIANCSSHGNLIGYAGIGGDAVHLHDNTFTGNSVGLAMVSAAPAGHPGLPQNHATVEQNVIGDNNADFYRFIRDGSCAKPAAQRDSDVVCPLAGVPVGTGVVNAGGDDDLWRANWVYGNDYAGFASWWVPGYLRSDDQVIAQVDTSNGNRYVDNTLGRTKDGVSQPNGVDFWWDGQGRGSCWQGGSTAAEPRALPRCNADGVPSGLAPRRYIAEPAQALQVYVCSQFDPTTGAIPSDCSWYGASGLQRVDVKWALGGAVLIGLLSLLVFARLLGGRGSGLAVLGLLLTLSGLGVGVYATWHDSPLLGPLGLAVLGAGWVFFGIPMRRRGRLGLGVLTISMGVFALLGAVDTGLMMIPYLPVPPSVVRIGLEVIWAPWALWAGLRGRVLAGTAETAAARSDPLVRFAHSLRW